MEPVAVFAITCLLIGISFALPYQLVSAEVLRLASPTWPVEVGNVYACAAWAGWAHFLYAFRGQATAMVRRDRRALLLFGALLCMGSALLWGARAMMGATLFSGLVWVYFIDHFLKAEQTFAMRPVGPHRWLRSYASIIAFGWLSVVLLNIGGINGQPWVLWLVSIGLGLILRPPGGWTKLLYGESKTQLMALYFIAEALIWGGLSRSVEPQFLAGVYVFHIAAGSYYHYLGSYAYAASRSRGRDRLLTLAPILGIHAVVFTLGILCARYDLWWLSPILGVQWFTLWVGVHLVASDLFPLVRSRWATPVRPI